MLLVVHDKIKASNELLPLFSNLLSTVPAIPKPRDIDQLE
jgi:hypothetical protein